MHLVLSMYFQILTMINLHLLMIYILRLQNLPFVIDEMGLLLPFYCVFKQVFLYMQERKMKHLLSYVFLREFVFIMSCITR